MITVLTNQVRNSLAASVLGSGSLSIHPGYIQWGTGSGNASGTDETLFNPVQNRVACSVNQTTTTTSGDTVLISGTITSTGTQSITNVGLFNVSGSSAVGYLTSSVSPYDTIINVSGYANFPNTYPFDVQILSEVMTVTTGTAGSWTVARNTNGSSRTLNVIPSTTQVVGGNNTANGSMFLKTSFGGGAILNAGDALQFKISLQFI